MEDFDSLVTEVETNSRYDAAVVSGNNGEVRRLLDELEPSKFVIQDISREEALVAFGNEMDGLTAAKVGLLRLVVGESGTVNTSRSEVRDRLVNIFGEGTPPVVRITAVAKRDATYGDAFGYPRVGLDTVRRAMRLIGKSFIVSSGQV